MAVIELVFYHGHSGMCKEEAVMTTDRQTENPSHQDEERSAPHPGVAEEIERIQALLRRLDDALDQKDEVTLKDLAQAVTTAGVGGRSIAQLRKLEKELALAESDEDYELARKSMFEMIEKLRRRRKAKTSADKTEQKLVE